MSFSLSLSRGEVGKICQQFQYKLWVSWFQSFSLVIQTPWDTDKSDSCLVSPWGIGEWGTDVLWVHESSVPWSRVSCFCTHTHTHTHTHIHWIRILQRNRTNGIYIDTYIEEDLLWGIGSRDEGAWTAHNLLSASWGPRKAGSVVSIQAWGPDNQRNQWCPSQSP